MLLWNYVFLPPLEPLLALPSPSVAATVTPTSLTSAVVILVLIVNIAVVVHHVPILSILRASLLVLARRAWRVVTPLTLGTVDPEIYPTFKVFIYTIYSSLSN
jgi:hypothetical protein